MHMGLQTPFFLVCFQFCHSFDRFFAANYLAVQFSHLPTSFPMPFPDSSGGGAALAEIQATVQQSLERSLRTKKTWSSTKTGPAGHSSENGRWDGSRVDLLGARGMILIAQVSSQSPQMEYNINILVQHSGK